MKARLIACCIIILLGISTYFNSIVGAFIWDDNHFVRNNESLGYFSNIPKIFTHNIAYASAGNYIYYRPLQEFTYMMDYHFWQLSPQGYHITNIFIHILVAISIFLLIQTLGQNIFISFLTSILFLVHPIHTEAVSYISGRGDPLCALFFVITLIIYIKNLEKGSLLKASLIFLSFLLSLLSKENSFIFPLIILAYHFCFSKKFNFIKFLPILLGLMSYVLWKSILVQSQTNIFQNLSGLQQRIPGFFYALPQYFKLLLWPYDLHFDYGQPNFSWSHLIVLFGILIFMSLLTLVVSAKKKNPLISFAIFWFMINLLPYSNALTLFNFMAEHFLYLASMGFFICLAIFFENLYHKFSKKLLIQIALCLIIQWYGCLTIIQNTYWLDPISFYKRTIQYNPLSFGSYTNLGVEYSRRKDFNNEIAMYERALQIKPDNSIALKNLGLALIDQNKLDQAEEYLFKAQKINPNLPQILNGLGVIAQKKGNQPKALEYFEKAILTKESYSDAYYNLANLYLENKKYDKAIETYQKIADINHSLDIKKRIERIKLLQSSL
jgi:tetratricopeptide (TPR) repeat protein